MSRFAAALQLYRAGKLAAASELCGAILADHPEQPEALHLLGIMHLQNGDWPRAAALIGRAAAARPNHPDYWIDLAEAHRRSGQAQPAVDCCRTALRLDAKNPDGSNTLGLALLDLQKPEEAAAAFRTALLHRPNFAAAHNNLGVALRTLSQPELALEQFRRAVELAADFAPAQANLGQLLRERGQPELALPHSRAAVRLQPNNADAHTDLASVLAALKQSAEAEAEYREALWLAPGRAAAHANLGRLLCESGRFGEAAACLKTAAELEPDNPAYWDELANAFWETGAALAAIAAWERALALDPNRAAARNALGWALHDEGRLAEAAACYQAARQLQPDLAAAHLNTGVLLEEQGDSLAAEDAYREAIRLQPAYALALARLATLRRGQLPAADRAAIDDCLANPQLPDGPRARLLFALALVADAAGDFSTAAEALRRANAISRDENRRRGEYDPATHERFVEGLIDGFGTAWFARTAGMGLPTRRPVFILGLPRSGTTLIEQILASHPAVHGAGELTLGLRGFDLIPRYLNCTAAPLQCLPLVDAAIIQRMAAQHLEHLNRFVPESRERIVDKMPDNYLYLGWLASLFPQAVFIHCGRDERDIALSCWMTDFRSIRWANDAACIAARFRCHRRLMAHWQAVCPVAIHRIRYEEAVADLEGVARRLVAACGLPWDGACLEFHRTRRTVRTASVTQVRQPLYGTSVGRWKNYEREIEELFDLLDREE